ncbi:sugar ABC transporter ATP-binding protein [Christensenella massiliensis]|uniref:Sugar ABC transporter ATP-binding protein n=1 Tax=Christensenella massiliensis TaxID=1805714 RepID=A0AAU8A8W0_9FIRM
MKNTPVIEIADMHMIFPGVHALKGVSFDLYAGEVHALVGENGAGKSTLIKILSGVYQRSRGKYLINGKEAKICHPLDAIKEGISVIYQELNLVSSLSAAENIFFGRLPAKGGRVQWKKLYDESRKYMEMVGLSISPRTKVQYLSIAEQQLVEIAKSLSLGAKIIIMDEPTSALSPKEVESLFKIIAQLKEKGVSIIYISHKLDEIFEIADRITVFKDGAVVGTKYPEELNEEQLIEMMVGRKMEDIFPDRNANLGEVLLDVKGLTTEKVTDISFHVRRGEIVGFSGLMGAGRTEMTMALLGMDKRLEGSVVLDGKEIPPNSPLIARESGMGLVVEDRRKGGILPNMSVKSNMTIVSLNQVTKGISISRTGEEDVVRDMIQRLKIKTPTMNQLIPKLSGGNQQKVLLARWLMKRNLKVLVIDEPTRGIDVGAKAEIYSLMNDLAGQGLAIIMVSSELPEILGMCDRVYVMKSGKITGEFNREEASEAALLEKAIH